MGLLDGVFETVSFKVDGLITYLVELAYNCLFAIFYPIYKLIEIVIGWIVYIWDCLYNFVFGFIDLINIFISFFYDTLFSWMPASILALLILGILIVVALRLYKFLSDIEIAGFKI